MILVSYDGSDDAQAAVDRAAVLLPGADVTVLTVWEPLFDLLRRSGAMGTGLGKAGTSAEIRQLDADAQDDALVVATEGAQRAAVSRHDATLAQKGLGGVTRRRVRRERDIAVALGDGRW